MRRQFPKAERAFYEIKAAVRAEDEPAATDLWIYDVIGDDWLDPSLTAKELCRRIAEIDTPEIVLPLASTGGSVSDGLAIYNALASHAATVSSRIEGWTASMATILALAADPGRISMFDNSMFMIHNPLMISIGDAHQLRQDADWLDQVGAQMRSIYMGRCRKSEEELRAALDAETWMSADEAAQWGFVDEVVAAKHAAAAFDVSAMEALGFRAPQGAGRTLSTENESKLVDARALIDEVLATLDARAAEPVPATSGDGPRTINWKALAPIQLASPRH